MSPEHLALLRAVGDAPTGDDTARLAYADYLDELGGKANAARAEFIRVQCAWAALPANDLRHDELEARFESIKAGHAAAWLAPFPEAVIRAAEFHRGFACMARVKPGDLDPRRPPPWHLEPDLAVWLETTADEILRALPAVAGAAGLWLSCAERADEDGDRLGAAVAAQPGLGSLRRLTLHALQVTDAGGRALAASPHLRNLRELSLWWNRLTAAGWKALADSPVLDTVEELDLSAYDRGGGGRYPGNAGAAALAASPRLARLRVLRVAETRVGGPGAAALAASPHLANLEHLQLSSLEWATKPFAAFLVAANLPALKVLDLGLNRLGRAAAALLARSPLLSRLTELDLAFNKFDAAAVESLLSAPDLARLEDLNLMGNPLRDDGFGLLAARGGKMTGLRRLSLSHTKEGLTDRAADALLAAEWLDQLDDLSLVEVKFSPAARKRLKRRFGQVVSFKY